jgi:subfamily B ATP-binding cassette protein HlyB/CyaB
MPSVEMPPRDEPPDDQAQAALAVATTAALLRVNADPASIARDFEAAGRVDKALVCKALRRLGLKARTVRLRPGRLSLLPTPAIIRLKSGEWATLARVSSSAALYQIPGRPTEKVEPSELLGRLEPDVILVAWRVSAAAAQLRFGIGWFLPPLWRYRPEVGQILVVALVLQLLALGSPLLFQIIMDKVLPHHALTTLNVVAGGMVGIAVFEAVLGWLRSYLTAHTASRLDVELGIRLYEHLTRLPLAYFQTRPVGQTVARVRELDTIREFLTGAALSLLLDVAFSVIAFALLCWYSLRLAAVVALAMVAYFVISVLISPLLRRQVENLFERAATNQSFLVESVSGAETVKAMALEPNMRHAWEGNLAGYVSQGFRLAMLGTGGTTAVTLVSKLSTVGILWLGVGEVHDNRLSIGALIAFNMIAGQLTAPVMRLAQMWQQFQQVRVGIERLGDILNTPVEPGSEAGGPALPRLTGRITFDHVNFRYTADAPTVLHDLSLDIEPGTVLGIIGQSGSGKSTIAKLVQRLHVPMTGRVLVDGHDLALVDPAWLRRQIGVVLQDSFLFNRSVRENIAVSRPQMNMDQVIGAARLAGAHEFILELPHGYDTILEERGTNLSGGQRQRIAIARALATDPRILILDEATSALDYESEAAFQQNLRSIAQGRTVVIIAHRLSAVAQAQRIIGLDRGRIVEDGSPEQLLASGGMFARLHAWQGGVR